MSLQDKINWYRGSLPMAAGLDSDAEFLSNWLRMGREMTAQAQLNGRVAGDTVELVLFPEIPRLASGTTRTISKAWLSVKDKQTDSDATENAAWSATAGARQSITTTETAGRGWIYNSNELTPELRFYITAANSLILNANQIYFFDIQISMSDGALYTVERGQFLFKKGITAASS